MDKIKIIACRCDKLAEVEEIDNSLTAMQEFVGGYIEMINLESGISLICHEEGKKIGLPINRGLGWDYVAGDCFLTRVDEEGNCVSVTSEDIEKYKDF
jgi:hypothetical protein